MDTINRGWLRVYLSELHQSKEVKIVSPFISEQIVNQLISKKRQASIKVITRFNLNDFRSGLSSIKAIERLMNAGAEIRGVRGLHSKLYLFDQRVAIVTSANFTAGGFFNNYEFGIRVNETETLESCSNYFEDLWSLSSDNLSLEIVKSWRDQLLTKAESIILPEPLPDFGAIALPLSIRSGKQFIKFFGDTNHRAFPERTVREEIENSHCHFAVTFSGKNGRPRRYSDGDIIYMGMMMHGGDYAIFGRAEAIRHVNHRDIASERDTQLIPWKRQWPVYIRVRNPVFIDGEMGQMPKMNDLINQLDHDAFQRTTERFNRGEKFSTRNTYSRKPDVWLSQLGAQWVENAFQHKKESLGEVPQSFLDDLYQGGNWQ